jgi:uncharacterized protein DUF6636
MITPLRLVAASVLVAAAIVVGTASGSGQRNGAFKTPSGNIVCGYGFSADGRSSSIGCGIKSGLRPAPRNTCVDMDYSGKSVSLTATGRARPVVCAGDPGPFLVEAKARVLGYGKSWHGGGIACTSRRAGLTCTNRRGHGFFLSHDHSMVF